MALHGTSFSPPSPAREQGASWRRPGRCLTALLPGDNHGGNGWTWGCLRHRSWVVQHSLPFDSLWEGPSNHKGPYSLAQGKLWTWGIQAPFEPQPQIGRCPGSGASGRTWVRVVTQTVLSLDGDGRGERARFGQRGVALHRSTTLRRTWPRRVHMVTAQGQTRNHAPPSMVAALCGDFRVLSTVHSPGMQWSRGEHGW